MYTISTIGGIRMSFDLEREEKPLEDQELEMVVQVIRRGLKDGDKIETLTKDLARFAVHLKEAGRRLKEVERIGQQIARQFEKAIDPQRKQGLTVAEAAERMRWIREQREKLAETLA